MKRADVLRLLLVLAFFSAMSALDSVVHGTLYEYGLTFSYSWAYPYWTCYIIVYLLFIYTLKSYFAFLLWLGNFQDILTFAFWQRNLSLSPWWWHPFYWLGVPWNLGFQVAMLLLVLTTGWLVKTRMAKYLVCVAELF